MGTDSEETTRKQIVRYYTAVQVSNALTPPATPTTRSSSRNSGSMEQHYSNGTPAERYWSSPAAQGSNKRQNVSSMLQSIFPDGLAPLAQKVATIERKEQVKALRQAARQAAAHAAGDSTASTSGARIGLAAAPSNAVQGAAASVSTATERDSGMAAAHAAIERSILGSVNAALVSPSVEQEAEVARGAISASSVRRKLGKHLGVSFKATAAEPTDASQGYAAMQQPSYDVRQANGASTMEQHTFAAASTRDSMRDGGAASLAVGDKGLHHRHYSRGQKLAAAILWETVSGKSQPVRLRQCLTYSEIRLKNLSCKETASMPKAEQQDSVRIAQEV